MLVLTRRVGETVMIGDSGDITATILEVNGNHVKIGVNAPRYVSVHREEVFIRALKEKVAANEALR